MIKLFRGGLLRLHGRDISRLQRLFDPLFITLLFIFLQTKILIEPNQVVLHSWLWVLGVVLVILPISGLYASFRSASSLILLRRVTSSWLLVVAALIFISFFGKTTGSFSRVFFSFWSFGSWLVLILNHVGLRLLLRYHRSRGGNLRTILYWGLPAPAAALAAQIQRNPWMGLRLVAWFSPEPTPPGFEFCDLPPCGGGYLAMRHFLQEEPVDRIVFSHVTRDGVGMDELVNLFGDTCVPVTYAPHWALPSMHFKLHNIGDIWCLDLWGSDKPISDRQIKRVFDMVISSIALVLISPLLFLIAVAVKLTTPGPVLFTQERYGRDGCLFSIYKFRTMSVLEAGDQPGLRQATRHDPRVTFVGAFLRRWSLDELPQLLNVLKGDMSLVGPRPHAVVHNEFYRKVIPGYMQRHSYRPGITGLAQVEGWRGETTTSGAMEHRIDADLRYQREWSLKLDIKILIKTLVRLRSNNAY